MQKCEYFSGESSEKEAENRRGYFCVEIKESGRSSEFELALNPEQVICV